MSQANYPIFDGDERSSLLKKVQTKDDFRAKKWRCVTHPVRAFETLSPYAVLEVGIMAARDLTERESGFFNTDTTPDPYVQVILDDTELEKCKTLPARRMKEPTWMYQCEVDVLAPTSMVRIQVKDDRPTEKADIGFFDVCLGDIPYDKAIEGWFELRFQESLLMTSVQRYQQHCEMREETLTEEEALRKKKEQASAPSVVPAADPDDKQTKLVTKTQLYAESKDRALDAFQACVHSTADISDQMGLETISKSLREGGRKKRSNAGEVYISLRLKFLVSRFDSLFAYAMDAPAPENLGGLKQDVKITRKIDVQRVYDDIMEVKVRVLDDAVLCCVYGFRYLVTWRSLPLSAIYLVGLLLCCWKTYLTWAIIPLLLAISLIVNRFPSARSYMTRGGQNAALTEEGFKHTAAWRDSGEVLKYVMRVLKEDMKAKLTDPRQLKTFASQAVRDGQPTLTLEQLRLALSAADFVEMEEQYFRKGDLVWVNGRFPAKVESTAGDPSAGTDRVLVTYEKSLVMEDLPPEEVRGRQVTLRADGLPNLDPLRKVPGGAGILDSAIEAIYPIIEDVRHLSLPGIHQLTEIFTWKKSTVTTIMVVVLLIISSLFGYAAWLHRTSGQNGNLSRKEEILISVLRSLDNWVAALIIVGIFFLQGWFMANVSSVIKIASRSTKGRPAPATWAFFTPDSVQADLLRSLAAKEADMHPHGGFHLPYMTGDGSSASASYAAAHAIGP